MKTNWYDDYTNLEHSQICSKIMKNKPDVGIKPVARKKVSDQIAEQLVTKILGGDLKTGERLPPERDLSEMFSISRLCLREALCAVEAMGLIETKQGDGSYVCDARASGNLNILDIGFSAELLSSSAVISEILDLRVVLLRGIIPMAVERMQDEDLENLRQAMRLARADLDRGVQEQAEYDYAFFERIIWATHSYVLILLLNSLKKIFVQITTAVNQTFKKSGEQYKMQWYEEMVKHIAAGDAAAAVDIAEKYLKQEKEDLIRAGFIST